MWNAPIEPTMHGVDTPGAVSECSPLEQDTSHGDKCPPSSFTRGKPHRQRKVEPKPARVFRYEVAGDDGASVD